MASSKHQKDLKKTVEATRDIPQPYSVSLFKQYNGWDILYEGDPVLFCPLGNEHAYRVCAAMNGAFMEGYLRAERTKKTCDVESQDHKERHILLHKYFDELLADFIDHIQKLPSETSIMELAQWSYNETIKPTEKGGFEK